MKKVFLTAAIIASLGIVSASAAPIQMPIPTQQTQEQFVKIEVTALPEAVTAAVAKGYEGSTIKEAFQNKEAKLYKVVITTSDAKEETAVYNEKGEVQKDQPAK